MTKSCHLFALRKFLSEASEHGVAMVMLAGEEPLLSADWLCAMGAHSDMLGLVFTNGTLIDASRASWFAEYRHIIPVLSIEGGEAQTNARRGRVVYAKVNQAMYDLRSAGIPCGVSFSL
jgi:MoaA/NifB/PqqE/SkfB family radical SAM enzyme